MQSLPTLTHVVSVPNGGSPPHLFQLAKIKRMNGFVGLANNVSEKRGICDFTGLPHVKLTCNGGAMASIYPFPMSDRIADQLAAQAAM